MRFVDFLKTTVLLNAGSATVLGAIAVAGAGARSDTQAAVVSVGWWLVATAIGLLLGRRAEVNPPIARLLATAKASNTLPEQRPAALLLNRLWPLLLLTIGAGAAGLLAPQVPGIAAGFPVIWALYWRRQEAAVAAIEERDGAQFFVERTSPLRPIKLVRATGFRAFRPQQLNGAAR
ncbi:MAG: hypothetical protein E6G56_05180 [Actinobacteria bacterium]|nr:MAG: hypothetical protein E6G56_05180 [Actinomycetota bacterium]